MRHFLTLLLSSFLSVVLAPLAVAEPELKGTPEELRRFLHPTEQRVTLRGDAQERAFADKAIATLIVTTEEDELAEAISENTSLRSELTRQLVHAGLDKEGINTAKFSTSPQYGWFGDDPDSFEVVNRVAVTVYDERQMEAVAALVDAHEEVDFGGNRFEHIGEDEMEAQVRKQALEDVMRQARAYESALGLRLVPASFHEAPVISARTREAGMQADVAMMAASAPQLEEKKAEPPEPVSFDEILYRATVAVQFRVEASD